MCVCGNCLVLVSGWWPVRLGSFQTICEFFRDLVQETTGVALLFQMFNKIYTFNEAVRSGLCLLEVFNHGGFNSNFNACDWSVHIFYFF